MTPTIQSQRLETKLWKAAVHNEERLHVREVLASRGPMKTSELATVLRRPCRQTTDILACMELACMIKVIGKAPRPYSPPENIWALRCFRVGE